MKNFSFKGRIIYFSLIAVVSLAFFALQLYSHLNSPSGVGSIVLLILWGILVLFGLAGIILSVKNRDRHQK
ncbi:hypothetical protein [Planococcus salinus]|uniref:Uncharacterized protein n=1 Tax=Planococcus salinus TaxID=1848460 RepID=A0A3M8P6A6_9BACL|nr:hypothetical protein [Planococcus salinus]RNF39142.1 hypothetical protein EEX84_10595 [Planococcus salinus]